MKPVLALVLALVGDFSARPPLVDPSRFELLRTAGARASTLSPAGNVFALYSVNSVTLYDLKLDRETSRLAGHNGNIHDSGWSRDGRVFATSGYDGTVRVLDVTTGRTLASIPAHAGYA